MTASRRRRAWWTDRFRDDPATCATRDAFTGIAAAEHDALLAAGDRMALHSALLAQRLYLGAARVREAFGHAGLSRWLALGEGLAAGDPPCRDGAAAFLALAPGDFGTGGLETAEAWCTLGCEVLAVSRRLATIFFRTTAPVLPRAGGMHRLRDWVGIGLDIYRERGWQGEFIAQAYFAAAPDAVSIFEPETYRLWAGLGAALYAVGSQVEVFAVIPAELADWTVDERRAFLQIALAVASVSRRSGSAVYSRLPAALAGLDARDRVHLLEVLVSAGRHVGADIESFVPVAGGILRQVPAPYRAHALELVGSVAGGFPVATVAALRSLPRLYEEADAARVAQWFAAGLAIAERQVAAGAAYFALESRTSVNLLHDGSTAVSLEEARGVLRKYVRMLSGSGVLIRPCSRFRLLPPIEEFPDEGEVALPQRVDMFTTHEENFRVYRLVAGHLAARREFGTYTFQDDEHADNGEPVGRALWRSLDAAERPELLEELFRLAEGVRVHGALCAAYRGLGREAADLAAALLEVWNQQGDAGPGRVVDTLFAFLITSEENRAAPAWISAELSTLVTRLVQPLWSPRATVYDSMRVARALADALSRSTAANGLRQVDAGQLFLDDALADALLESWFEEGAEAGPAIRAPGDATEQGPAPAPTSEDGRPLELGERSDGDSGGAPMSPEELRRLIESGVSLDISQGSGQELEGLGLYLTDLVGKIPDEQLVALRKLLGEDDTPRRATPRRWVEDRGRGASFYYDEWDYHISDYRSRWCRLREINLSGDAGEFFNQTLTDYADLIPEVRRQFQRVRPEMYRRVRGLEDGEDFDLNALVEAKVEMRARRAPSSKLYVARQREERDIAALFLVDMSASTDEPLERGTGGSGRGRRIVDVTREALVVMAAALAEIGDAFAIYGFSGHGRDDVEFYRVKSFAEPLNSMVKGRIGDIEPKRSTRMGTALRHAIAKMATVNARSKHLFLLSDGFPQDHDYGQDRRSNVYGIRDTAAALRETTAAGIVPFCITVDRAGHDYLRQMCDESRYLVIDDVTQLPRQLPKVYQRVVRG